MEVSGEVSGEVTEEVSGEVCGHKGMRTKGNKGTRE